MRSTLGKLSRAAATDRLLTWARSARLNTETCPSKPPEYRYCLPDRDAKRQVDVTS